jgi:CRISPR-associated endonuclease/helicase Cas3
MLDATVRRVHRRSLEVIDGPADLEQLERYSLARATTVDAWLEVRSALSAGRKVLWVSNTVRRAMDAERQAIGLPVTLYHSRFRYEDRVQRHRELIDKFNAPGPVLACTTQVAEMSLDLSADLLVTDIAPIPALIQRLGRLNRRSSPERPNAVCRALVLDFEGPPYGDREGQDLADAAAWLASLGPRALSQRMLVDAWVPSADSDEQRVGSSWLDGGAQTSAGELREGGVGITVLRSADADRVRKRAAKSQRVALPMDMPRGTEWLSWPRVDFLPVAPPDALTYDPNRGGEWVRR